MSASKTLKAVGNTAVIIAAVVACVVAALMFVPGLLGYDRYVITGGSMSGTFERGSLVFERQVPVEDLNVGDVITYLPPAESGISELVTHRVISITPNPDVSGGLVFKTKGDANASADPWTFTLADTVQPRVLGWIPLVGWIFIALSAPRHPDARHRHPRRGHRPALPPGLRPRPPPARRGGLRHRGRARARAGGAPFVRSARPRPLSPRSRGPPCA